MTQKKTPVGFKLKFLKGNLSLLKTVVSHLKIHGRQAAKKVKFRTTIYMSQETVFKKPCLTLPWWLIKKVQRRDDMTSPRQK